MLEKNIADTLNQSLKNGEKTRVSVLRMLRSEIANKKIEDGVKELNDEKIVVIVQKMARQHKESIEKFREGGRDDLVKKETEELAVLEEYLPEQLSEEELSRMIAESITRTGASSPGDMGRVMSDVMSRVQGRADGKTVNRIVIEKLT